MNRPKNPPPGPGLDEAINRGSLQAIIAELQLLNGRLSDLESKMELIDKFVARVHTALHKAAIDMTMSQPPSNP